MNIFISNIHIYDIKLYAKELKRMFFISNQVLLKGWLLLEWAVLSTTLSWGPRFHRASPLTVTQSGPSFSLNDGEAEAIGLA